MAPIFQAQHTGKEYGGNIGHKIIQPRVRRGHKARQKKDGKEQGGPCGKLKPLQPPPFLRWTGTLLIKPIGRSTTKKVG